MATGGTRLVFSSPARPAGGRPFGPTRHRAVAGGHTVLVSSLVGRLLRYDDGRWAPVGEPLPPFAHAPPDPRLPVAPWVLPRDLAAREADVLVVGELAHQLLVRCQRDDPLYLELAEQTMLLRDHDETMAWLAQIELWVGRRLDPDQPWPTTLPAGPGRRSGEGPA